MRSRRRSTCSNSAIRAERIISKLFESSLVSDIGSMHITLQSSSHKEANYRRLLVLVQRAIRVSSTPPSNWRPEQRALYRLAINTSASVITTACELADNAVRQSLRCWKKSSLVTVRGRYDSMHVGAALICFAFCPTGSSTSDPEYVRPSAFKGAERTG